MGGSSPGGAPDPNPNSTPHLTLILNPKPRLTLTLTLALTCQEVHQTPPSSTPASSMQASARAALGSAPNGVGGAAKPSLADIHFLSPLAGGKWNEEVPEAEFIHWAVHAGDKVLEIGT